MALVVDTCCERKMNEYLLSNCRSLAAEVRETERTKLILYPNLHIGYSHYVRSRKNEFNLEPIRHLVFRAEIFYLFYFD